MTSEGTSVTSQGSIHQRVAAYYASKLREHGPTPRGVDWRDRESQEVRFDALLKIADVAGASLIELGCGYGALYGYIRQTGLGLTYAGYDIAQEMVDAAGKT